MQQVLYFLLIDLHQTHLYLCIGNVTRRLDSIEDATDESRNETFTFCFVITVTSTSRVRLLYVLITFHRVGFPTSGLSIGKDRGVITTKQRLLHLRSNQRIHNLLMILLVKDVIKACLHLITRVITPKVQDTLCVVVIIIVTLTNSTR